MEVLKDYNIFVQEGSKVRFFVKRDPRFSESSLWKNIVTGRGLDTTTKEKDFAFFLQNNVNVKYHSRYKNLVEMIPQLDDVRFLGQFLGGVGSGLAGEGVLANLGRGLGEKLEGVSSFSSESHGLQIWTGSEPLVLSLVCLLCVVNNPLLDVLYPLAVLANYSLAYKKEGGLSLQIPETGKIDNLGSLLSGGDTFSPSDVELGLQVGTMFFSPVVLEAVNYEYGLEMVELSNEDIEDFQGRSLVKKNSILDDSTVLKILKEKLVPASVRVSLDVNLRKLATTNSVSRTLGFELTFEG